MRLLIDFLYMAIALGFIKFLDNSNTEVGLMGKSRTTKMFSLTLSIWNSSSADRVLCRSISIALIVSYHDLSEEDNASAIWLDGEKTFEEVKQLQCFHGSLSDFLKSVALLINFCRIWNQGILRLVSSARPGWIFKRRYVVKFFTPFSPSFSDWISRSMEGSVPPLILPLTWTYGLTIVSSSQ